VDATWVVVAVDAKVLITVIVVVVISLMGFEMLVNFDQLYLRLVELTVVVVCVTDVSIEFTTLVSVEATEVEVEVTICVDT
jgi:hypothetical protein